MFLKQKIGLIIFMLCFETVSFSQANKPKIDSLEIYVDIQNYSKKNKFTRFMHKLVFEPIHVKSKKKKIVIKKLSNFEGKIIRNIIITTLDPFGYSEIDSTKSPKNWNKKTGNRLHIKTQRLAIKNLLLFKKNKPLDSLLIKESERLIRKQNYINRVAISPKLIANNPDSVDVYIRVLDSWSFIPKGSVNNSKTSLGLREINFSGSGHEFDAEYINRFSDGKKAYNLDYIIPNIKNSYIKTTVNYHIDLEDNFIKSINIERPFYSPFAKWAGGLYFDQQYRKDSIQDINLIYSNQNFKYNSQDYWLGHAFRIYKGNSENNRTTNLILSARFLNIKYIESPTIVYDPSDFYSNEKFILFGIGINSRKYVQDRYVFRNGIIEDVPIGKTYGITSGYQHKNNLGRYYYGGQASFGNYFDWGFLSTNFELGTFLKKSKASQTVFSFQANYYTNLFEFGKWKVRQFIKPQLILGYNRVDILGDKLSLNDHNGLDGFKSAEYGEKKMILTLQTQAYSPWNLGGFRLNPYFNYSIAALGTKNRGLLNSKAFSKISIGFIIQNDYLVFSSFQISLSYFPSIPDSGENIFKTNSFETTDFGFQDFELGKPRTVIYK